MECKSARLPWRFTIIRLLGRSFGSRIRENSALPRRRGGTRLLSRSNAVTSSRFQTPPYLGSPALEASCPPTTASTASRNFTPFDRRKSTDSASAAAGKLNISSTPMPCSRSLVINQRRLPSPAIRNTAPVAKARTPGKRDSIQSIASSRTKGACSRSGGTPGSKTIVSLSCMSCYTFPIIRRMCVDSATNICYVTELIETNL